MGYFPLSIEIYGFHKLVIECHNIQVGKMLANDSREANTYALARRVLKFLEEMEDVKIKHADRELNSVADSMAKLARRASRGLAEFEAPFLICSSLYST